MILRTTLSIVVRWMGKHCKLLQGLLGVSLFQLMVISYMDLGKQLIANTESDWTNNFSCSFVMYHRLDRIDAIRLAFEVSQEFTLVFAIELAAIFIYSFCQSLRSKRIAAIAIWLSPLVPLVLSIDLLPYATSYLLSPLASLHFSWGLVNIGEYCRQKDFYPGEGMMYSLAVLGVFNLFWLIQIARNWTFPIHPKSKI